MSPCEILYFLLTGVPPFAREKCLQSGLNKIQILSRVHLIPIDPNFEMAMWPGTVTRRSDKSDYLSKLD